jgi:hypothetical protein
LVARKGEKKRGHFAAKAMCDPVAARETIFHRLAKQVLSDERSLLLPLIKLQLENRIVTLRPKHVLRNVEVLEEHQIEDSPFVADSIIILDVKGTRRRLVVEWVVTHPCEPQKVDFLRSRRVPTIEILIGEAPDSLSSEQAKKWILFDAPRKWIWHPLFEWGELLKRGVALERKPAFRAVRFFKTRSGTKAVETEWVKGCPVHARVVSISVCECCPYAYYVEYYQGGYVDCLFGGSERFLDGWPSAKIPWKRLDPDAASTDPSLWYERATPNLGSGFRVGWDKPRSDLVPEVVAAIQKGPFAEPPAISGRTDKPAFSTDA